MSKSTHKKHTNGIIFGEAITSLFVPVANKQSWEILILFQSPWRTLSEQQRTKWQVVRTAHRNAYTADITQCETP